MNNENGLTPSQLAERNATLVTEIEKCCELSGCPAGVDLQDWVKKLADELNAERTWESVVMEVCGEDGQELVAAVINALTALAAENAVLMEDRDTLAGYWIEDGGDKDCAMSYCEPTPATDRIVAGIKADAANQMCVAFVKHKELAGLSDDDVVTVREATDAVLHCAEVISEGADK